MPPKKQAAKKKASRYPEPKLARGQVLFHMEFRSKQGDEKLPVAAYPVSSTPHMVIHKAANVNETGDGVETINYWTVSHVPTGRRVSPGLDTLKKTKDVVEKMGRLGDWSTEESVAATVPYDAKFALRNIGNHSREPGYVAKVHARLEELYREQESQKQAESKSAKPKAVKSKPAKPKTKTVTFKDGKGMANPSGKKQAQDVPVDEPPGRRRTPASKGRGRASKDKGRKVNIKMS